MHKSKFNDFKELNWRRRLNPSETAELRRFLAESPEAAADWQAEEALSRALEQLPAPVASSNFTARVLAAANRETTAQARGEDGAELPWFFRSWWPRLAAGAVMMGVGFLSFQEFRPYHRAGVGASAESILPARQLAAVPPVDWLQNFDTIQRLDKVKVADDELLSALE